MAVDEQDQRSLALWAADCAEHVLGLFEAARPGDDRPRRAVDAARAWARGEIRVGAARTVAFAAHAAAREADDPAARAAARSAGHAVATAHMAGHARHAATYAATAASLAAAHAIERAGDDPAGAVVAVTTPAAADERERAWQVDRIPEHLRTVALPHELAGDDNR